MSSTQHAPLRVCIDARLVSGMVGGIEQAIQGLVTGLSRLRPDDLEFLILTFRGHRKWIEDHASGPCRVVETSKGPPHGAVREWLKNRHGSPTTLWGAMGRAAGLLWMSRARSDGTAERKGASLVHTMVQPGFRTELPVIYEVYDLQHLHLPENFTAFHQQFREAMYRGFCRRAQLVTVMSPWVRGDLVARYGLPPQKVAVVPFGSVHEAWPDPAPEELAAVGRRYSVPSDFALFPAQTWPHKNHLGLLQALAHLRRQNVRIPLVAPGRKNAFYPQIERRIRELGLESQVQFPGFVPPEELRCLYQLARLVVFPSRFEGGGMPLLEGLRAGVPTACSNLPGLSDLADGAALLFDPQDATRMAEALERLWTDGRLRRTLAARGKSVARRYTWERAARTSAALYRRTLGRPARAGDDALLYESFGSPSPPLGHGPGRAESPRGPAPPVLVARH